MRLIRARAMGFCFGVRDALAVADSLPHPAEVHIYGELVHNEQVTRRLAERGFHACGEHERCVPLDLSRVLITAHGISQTTRDRLVAAGKELIDTTCPLVRRVHAAAQRLAGEGRHVVVIGQPGHVEVQGIVEDLPGASVAARVEDVVATPHARLGIVCQSTTPPDVAAAVLAQIVALHPAAHIEFVDTVCQPTRDRQAAVEELLGAATLLIVVGGRKSNNSRALAERAQRRGIPSRLIQTAADLDLAWFRPEDVVGLTAGTSTPDDVIDAVALRLEEIAATLASPAAMSTPVCDQPAALCAAAAEGRR